MRFIAVLAVVGLGFAWLPAPASELDGKPASGAAIQPSEVIKIKVAKPAKPIAPKDDKVDGCGSYGTTIEFVDSPKEAAKQALKEEKLVFVLHVSGEFEDPGLT